MKDRVGRSYHHTLLLNRERSGADLGQAPACCSIHLLGKTASPFKPPPGPGHHGCHRGPAPSAKGLTWHLATLPQSLPAPQAQERVQPVQISTAAVHREQGPSGKGLPPRTMAYTSQLPKLTPAAQPYMEQESQVGPKRARVLRERLQQRIEGNSWKNGRNPRGKCINGLLWNLKQKEKS